MFAFKGLDLPATLQLWDRGTQLWHTGRITSGLETMWRTGLALPGALPDRRRKAVPCTERGTLVLNADPGWSSRHPGPRALWGWARATHHPLPPAASPRARPSALPRSRPGPWLAPLPLAPPIPGAEPVPAPAWPRPPEGRLGSTFPAVSMAAGAGGVLRRPGDQCGWLLCFSKTARLKVN